jgi:hypothetical protein
MKLSVYGEYGRIYRGWLIKNSSPKRRNEIKLLRRMRKMKLSTLGENGE